jgi:hypothetical protein
MHTIDWSRLRYGVTEVLKVKHKQHNRIAIAIKGYKRLTWFIKASKMATPIDIISDGRNIASFFPFPKPIGIGDETTLFECIVACLRSLESQKLALDVVNSKTFDYNTLFRDCNSCI